MCAAVVAALLLPATAAAGTVTAGSFTAAPGEKNDVRYDAFGPPPITVVDLGAPLIVGAGCTDGTPVTCEYTGSLTLHLGDRADRGFASATIAAQVYGEEGADVIHADAEEPGATGARATTRSRSAATSSSATASAGTTARGPFQGAVATSLWGEEGDDTLIQRAAVRSLLARRRPGRGPSAGIQLHPRGGPGDDVMTRSSTTPSAAS